MMIPSHILQLDKLCASSKTPIRIDGVSPYSPICTPLEPTRVEFLKTRWATENLSSAHMALRDGLLVFGGQSALIPELEEDLSALLHRGQLWGATSKVIRGRQSKCHENSCHLWEANQDKLYLATGYALSTDGLWRQHSWCVYPKARSINIVETTEPRELYFGFVMTIDETLRFGTNNTDMGIDANEETKKRYPLEIVTAPESESKTITRSRRRP